MPNHTALPTKVLCLAAALLSLATAVPFAIAQPRPPTYDVVSIKLNKSGSDSTNIDSNDRTYIAQNISLKQLLAHAYNIKEDLISGIPGAIDSARFDVAAKILQTDPEALKALSKQHGAMMQAFLADRFHLKAHQETKSLPVYELVVIKSGIKFKQTPAGAPPGSHIHGTGRTAFTANNIPMNNLASFLEDRIHRTILNKTNLPGNYDLALKWAPDNPADSQTDPGPSLFTAVEEQLGLKLQPAKGPVETLVVDHVEMPSEN